MVRISIRLAAALLLLAAGCAIDPVDFNGKSCAVPGDCPDGYRCEALKCVSAGSPADAARAGADAAAAPDSGAEIPPDGGEASAPDASAAEVPDGSSSGLDASGAAGPDGSTATPDGSVGLDASGAGGQDAAAPAGQDAASPAGQDAASPAGQDAAAPAGQDAASPAGQDAALAAGADAATAGQDAGVCSHDSDCPCSGTGCATCCHQVCETPGAPLLQKVSPSSVPVGSATTVLQLSGQNFSACAQVMVNGQSVVATPSSATSLSATVPGAMLKDGAALPVQVLNPGPGGGVSNPNATLLASVTLPKNSNPVGLEFLVPDTLAIADDAQGVVYLYDATGLTDSGKSINLNGGAGGPATLRGNAGQLFVPINPNHLVVITDPLNAATQVTLNLNSNLRDLDLDEGGGIGVIAQANGRYQTFPLVSPTLSAVITVNNPRQPQGVAIDALTNLLLMPGQTSTALITLGQVTTVINPAESGTGAVIDHDEGRGYTGSTQLHVFNLSTAIELTPINVAVPLHWMRFNPLSRQVLGVPNGTGSVEPDYDVGLVDGDAARLTGYLGSGGKRGCGEMTGNNVMHEGIAFDPQHNRAFVSQSCDGTVEAYNLNVLMVDLPPVTITSLQPPSTPVDLPVNLKVLGTGFTSAASVTFNQTAVTPTSVTATEIDFSVGAASLTCGGTATVQVANTDPARWNASQNLTITAPTPVLNSVTVGVCPCTPSTCAACSVTAHGSGFMPGCSSLFVNGSNAAATGTAIALSGTVTICPGTTCGATQIPVYVSTPGGGSSATVNFLH